MSLDLYASSLTTSGAILSSSTISSTGNHDTSVSYLIKGSTVLTSTTLGTGVTGSYLTDTSGASFTIAGSANSWALSLTAGTIKPSGVFAKCYSASAGSISDPTSALTGGSSTYDVYPTTSLGSGYGWQDTSGSTYYAQYRAPCSGIYLICVNARFSDTTSVFIGLKLYKYTGSILTSLVGGDGVIWASNDGYNVSNRRHASFQTQVLLSKGNGVFPSVYGSGIATMSWCQMDVVLIHAT